MKEFLLIFRRDYLTPHVQPSPDQMQEHVKRWQQWFEILANDDRLARQLQRWDSTGKVLVTNKSAINGPYAETKESIGGLIIIYANDYQDAVEIAKGSPIFEFGGNVEIRMGL